jgi:hypothetical protein|tara:strand:+ start:685 stop:840 length:156 start_codon:yes stop_codon:yes gene_type:complete
MTVWTILLIYTFHSNQVGIFVNKEECLEAVATLEQRTGTKGVCIQEREYSG